MKYLKVHKIHFIIAAIVFTLLLALLFILLFFDVEKSKQVVMKVGSFGTTELWTDTMTANLLRSHSNISISLDDGLIDAVITGIKNDADHWVLTVQGTEGLLLPGTDVLVSIIYETTTLFNTMFGL